jgi:DNA polymerase III alpha subunit
VLLNLWRSYRPFNHHDGVLIMEKVIHAKQGNPMGFVSFEDLTGLYAATIFPDVYRKTRIWWPRTSI